MIERWRQYVLQHALAWYGTIMLLTALGCIAGAGLFMIAALEGATQFAVVGGLVGIVGGISFLLLQRSRSKFQLREVKISFAGNEAVYVVNARYRQAAWQLFVETMTRIATQQIGPEQGRLREAMSSLYSLFQTTRDLLKEMEPTPTAEGNTVEMLALEMLNAHLRPFLSRWHPSLASFEKANPQKTDNEWEDSQSCRAELDTLRDSLQEYAKSFGQLAGVQQLERFFGETIIDVVPANESST